MNWTQEEYNDYMAKQDSTSLSKPVEVWTIEMYREYMLTGKEPKKDKIPSKPKYKNKKVEVDGILFASKKEADYYKALLLLKRIGEVVEFELQPEFIVQDGYIRHDGKKIRPIIYRSDFRVVYTDGREEIVDTKGFKTKEFILKRKMFELRYPSLILKVI